MGVKLEGILSAEQLIESINRNGRKRALRFMRKKASEIQKLAIKMAPVDEGNLEAAIKIRGMAGDGQLFTKKTVEVYIDMDMSAVPSGSKSGTKSSGKKVGDYAYEIHEHLQPVGPMRLGKKSNIKNDNNGGVTVGGAFMTRAADEVLGDSKYDFEIDQMIDDILGDLL